MLVFMHSWWVGKYDRDLHKFCYRNVGSTIWMDLYDRCYRLELRILVILSLPLLRQNFMDMVRGLLSLGCRYLWSDCDIVLVGNWMDLQNFLLDSLLPLQMDRDRFTSIRGVLLGFYWMVLLLVNWRSLMVVGRSLMVVGSTRRLHCVVLGNICWLRGMVLVNIRYWFLHLVVSNIHERYLVLHYYAKCNCC